MSVDDHGLEALRKSAHEVTQGNKAEYYILTKIVDALVGSFTPSGLQNGGSIVEVEVNDATWTELSGPLFSTRNAINIQNKSSTNPNGSSPIKLNYVNTEPLYIGVEIDEGNERQYAVQDIKIYAKSKSGTFKITLEEIS